MVLKAVAVDPLAYADRCHDGSREDLATGNPSEAILLAARLESDLNAASEGVAVHGTGTGAVAGVDLEHGSVACELREVYRVWRAINAPVVPDC